jgi:hypothetical protein
MGQQNPMGMGGRPLNIKLGETVRTIPGVTLPPEVLAQQQALQNSSIAQIDAGAALQAEQASEQAKIIAERNQALADLAKQEQDREKAQTEAQKLKFDEIQQLTKELDDKKIDPKKYWKEIGAGGSILSIIGAGLGAARKRINKDTKLRNGYH